jgi:hypothetical protein
MIEAVAPGALPAPKSEAHDPQDGEDHGDDPQQMDRESQPEEQKYKEQCNQ